MRSAASFEMRHVELSHDPISRDFWESGVVVQLTYKAIVVIKWFGLFKTGEIKPSFKRTLEMYSKVPYASSIGPSILS